MTFLEDLQARKLPPVMPEGMTAAQWPAYRKQLLELFSREEYGFTPPPPNEVRAGELPFDGKNWAGKAVERLVSLSFDTPNGEFSFPVNFVLPVDPQRGEPLRNTPLAIYISFRSYPDCYYLPVEEIIDNGYALATFNYNDVSLDEQDGWLTDGIAAMYPRRGDGTDWGQCGMWAFAASRVLDYALTLDEIDKTRVFVAGHSRLGKTALWCAAQDERFAGAGVNDSGFGGMAITRGKQGEQLRHLPVRIERWFCGNFLNWVERENDMPFDAHMLGALIAPRLLAVCNAELDTWADPQSEFMALVEAGKAYELLGVPGLIAPAEYPPVGARFPEGRIGYSLRAGTHFMSRADWGFYLKFWNRKTP
ncbi:MAG: S9 family peptidase [Firmicutes bacterium]|nr:S9 family peptidase [Bacillota bacterium]